MDELSQKLAKARDHVAVEVDDATLDRQWRGLGAKRRRRTVSRVAVSAALVLLAAFGSWRWMTPTEAPVAASPSLRLPDGSLVFFLEPNTEVTRVAIDETHVDLELSRGSARFEVSHRPARSFVVATEDVKVTVIGTQFVVTHGDETVEVDVLEGRVQVEAGDETRLLSAGEHGRFAAHVAPAPEPEPEVVPEPEVTPPSPARQTPPTERVRVERPSPRAASWRVLAEEGRFDEAYEALAEADDVRTTDVGDLMLAADAARLSGHSNEAVGYLRQVVDEHASDSRAPLAAFTLGRVLLRSRPAEAAEAFAQTSRLDPDSSLAQDAMAREVEAWHRAGRQERARALAETYVARFPSGVRIDAVRRFGGLD
ncbi:MAG: FecR domain-containing protein [Sandaracinus sp.]|nr:FecR domain-containing protein [Sandaracinus sp.]MCB9610841.1 FecR domain-containing protein [Sandaracinus sp.]MCB9633928.1 FecR domain-containing protein [Sandaracinus sp.]